MSTATQRLLPTVAPGSVTRAPHLPAGFTDTFTSYLVDTGRVRLHAVVGGGGPPLLLVPGWPENWFAWREMMPALALVVAADPRGVNLSDRAPGGYDAGNLAADLVALMEEFAHKASTPAAVPGYAVNYYVEAITRDPEALHRGTFGFYRAIDQTVEQNIRRQQRRLQLPILAIGGADGLGEAVAATMRLVADDVTPVVLERCGHYVADEAAEGMLEALEPFLAPYAAGK